ncbi:MAG: 16S rRNA (adenine(1518)-N(6)/adenine(1519)-N(6))-dimethyltransferase RsmA [Gammaproteobacteria bacterium]|nr:16S rRNA (adenine(1518)-N(6)/adenine(1519)-N(6))-dimethyltransferase RsmA [Gammaproteobacteria bacterium]
MANSRFPPHARKRFSQNFLHDPAVIQKIVAAIAPQSSDHMLEIGPGRGAITQKLLAHLDQLTAIEIDRDLASALSSAEQKLNVIQNDILNIQLDDLDDNQTQWRVVGNLPYNVSSPILFHLFQQIDVVKDIYIMLQKEVGDRLAAAPGSKTYGRLSVMAQSYVSVEKLFDIGPGAFQPAPKVKSTFLQLTPLPESLLSKEHRLLFDQIVRFAFQQRRKTLVNALANQIFPNMHDQPLEKAFAKNMLQQCGLDEQCRAEQLSVNDFAQLAHQLRQSC